MKSKFIADGQLFSSGLYTPPLGNPEKSQVNRAALNSSYVVINQNYKTDMVVNGAREPIESAKAVTHSQYNSMVIAARNAKALLV